MNQEMRVCLSRWVCQDVESNLARFEGECGRAVEAGATIVVFPELFLTGYTREVDPADVRDRFSRLSADAPETLFLFGSISEERRNRLTAWAAGEQIAFYDKIHLFDVQLMETDERYHESNTIEPGDQVVVLDSGRCIACGKPDWTMAHCPSGATSTAPRT